jgi:OOP family OmpA-OmpF porin
MLAIEWLMRMERRTILGGGVFALALLALVCIPRHLPLSASPPVPVPANFHARLEQGTLMLRGSLPDAGARDRILERARAAFSPAQVRVLDQLTIDGRIAAPSWVNHLPAVLPVLEQMQGVRSVMIDGAFSSEWSGAVRTRQRPASCAPSRPCVHSASSWKII